MIDIVIPIYKGPKNYLELRYALRSIEKYTNVRNVILIGLKPNWVQNVHYIPFVDGPHTELNTMNKVRLACQMDYISDPFLLSNDDFFFLRKTDIGKYPYRYSCMLSEKRSSLEVGDRRIKVFDEISKEVGDMEYCENHEPIRYAKSDFLFVSDERIDGALIRSLYIYWHLFVPATKSPDCKLTESMTKEEIYRRILGRDVFSTGALKKPVREVLEELYPTPSKYEH